MTKPNSKVNMDPPVEQDKNVFHPQTGKLPQYIEGDSFEEYLLQVDFFFEANRITSENDKRATLLTCIGKSVFSIARNLLQPSCIKDVPYDTIIDTLKSHYAPSTSIIMERFRFYNAQQMTDDVSTFIIRIKKMASKCNFGTFLNEAMRDKLVCGLTDDKIQNRLLSEKDLTFTKACEIALAIETAYKEAKSLNTSGVSNVLKIKDAKHNYVKGKNNNLNSSHLNNSSAKQANFSKGKVEYSKNKTSYTCKHCGKMHRGICRFKNAICYKCKLQGHISKICKVSTSNFLDENIKIDNKKCIDTYNDLYLNNVYNEGQDYMIPKPYNVDVKIGDARVKMQIDSGSANTIISYDNFERLNLSNLKSLESPTLCSYSGDKLDIAGHYLIPVIFNNKSYMLPIVVVNSFDKPTLLGRLWMEKLGMSINKIEKSKEDNVNGITNDMISHKAEKFDIVKICDKYKEKFPNCFNFKDSSGIKGEPINIAMKEDTIPVFCKSRPIAYAMRHLVEDELDSLIKTGVLYPVSHSKWATPIVAVPKIDSQGNKTVRICGDFSVTVNKFCETQFYPLPSQEEILTNMGSGKYFTKIDLSKAFHQLPIAPESQELLTLNTPKGLLRYSKLPFGIKSASFLFQQKMDDILKDFTFTDCYIDDLIIRADSREQCIERTMAVLKRLNDFNVKINISKCEFFKDTIKILGHLKDTEGIHPIIEKCDDIMDMPKPNNVTELKSYLGMLGYYQHFIPNLSGELKPLYRLLEKDTKWNFDESCNNAFKKSKLFLKKYNVLIHYDSSKPIVLQCDASEYGIGAVLCHDISPGILRPIFCASKTLSKAERNYAQVHKEALAIIFGIKRFNKFLQGKKFTIETDSKPLLTLFGHNKSVPEMANARMQRWSLILASYDYEMKYKNGSKLVLADAFSRLPHKNDAPVDDFDHILCFFSDVKKLTNKEVQKYSSLDPDISKVMTYVKFGWPNMVPNEISEYKNVRNELSVEGNCLLRANRLIIPKILQGRVLEILHEEHPGIVRMKHLARSYFWFPHIDEEIEKFVNSCTACQVTRPSATIVKSSFWPLTSRPFERIHIDYAELENKNLLIVKDAYSKWIDVFLVNNIDSNTTIAKLRSLFSYFGLPNEIVSDNAAQFKSERFLKFFQANGVTLKNSPPYHPNSNGAAEKSVNIVKNMLKKHKFSNRVYEDFQHRLDSSLFAYRNTPHSVTLKTPSELLLKFVPQTKITKLRFENNDNEKRYQEYQKNYRNKNAAIRSFSLEEKVWVRSVRNDQVKWFPGKIVRVISANTYIAEVLNKTRFVHADHLRKYSSNQMEILENKASLNIPILIRRDIPDVDERVPKTMPAVCRSSIKETMKDPKEQTEMDEATFSADIGTTLADEGVSSSKISSNSKTLSSPKTFQKVKTPRPKRHIKPPVRLNL